MFPRGLPGLALLLLRVSVAASVLLNAGSDPHLDAWRIVLTVVLAIALGGGVLTPIAALLTIPVYLIETASVSLGVAGVLSPILQAIALSLLGPGLWSIDAYLFGHRVVVLSKSNDRNDSERV